MFGHFRAAVTYLLLKCYKHNVAIRKVEHYYANNIDELLRKVEQSTVNQRIKFLIENLNLSARAFSDLIGESPTTTHNYTSQRNAEPRASYLSKVLFHFKDVDARWLMTGEGNAFTSAVAETGSIYQTNKKVPKSQRVGRADGNTIQNMGQPGDPDLRVALALSKQEAEGLKAQLSEKERTIQILLNQLPK